MRGIVKMIKKEKIVEMLMILLIFVTIVDPANQIFKIKSLIFLITIFMFLVINYRNKNNLKLLLLILLISLLVPLFSIFIGVIHNSSFELGIGLDVMKSYMFFSIVIALRENVKKYNSVLKILMIGISIIVLVINIILIYNHKLFSIIYLYSLEKQNMMIANRKFGNLLLQSIYYKTIILAIIPFSFYFQEFMFTKKNKMKNIFLSFVLAYGIFISGTRANLISLGYIVLAWLLYFSVKKKKLIILLLSLACMISALDIVKNNFFEKTEHSNLVKLGHYTSYSDEFQKMNLITGEGAGTRFYTKGFNSYAETTELTYFELFRRMGIWGIILHLVFLLYPLFKLRKRMDILIWYSIYIVIAGTNPLLFSSTGMLLMAFVYAEIFKKEVVEYECKSVSTYVNL